MKLICFYKLFFALIIVVIVLVPHYTLAIPNTLATPSPVKMQAMQQAAQLLFTENRGQVIDDKGQHRPDILFTGHSGGAQLFLTAAGISYQFTKTTYPEGYDGKQYTGAAKQAKTETCRFSLTLMGASVHPIIHKELKNTYVENFYTTGCPDGITGVATYQRIVYENVYPHIDWVVYSNGDHLKYDFLVHPGGDPKQIKLKINDAQSVTITHAGELVIRTVLGEVWEQAPVSYRGDAPVDTWFKKNKDGSIGFGVAACEGELRIDPSVAWATYYGGSGNDVFASITTDASGNILATGQSSSATGIASTGSYQSALIVTPGQFEDAILVKFNATGNRLWATYYGGTGEEQGRACTTDAAGNIFITGIAASHNLTTAGAYQDSLLPLGTTTPPTNVLLVKFNSNGARLWATYYGYNYTAASACSTDGLGNVYIAGITTSTANISTPGAYQTAMQVVLTTVSWQNLMLPVLYNGAHFMVATAMTGLLIFYVMAIIFM